MSDRTVVYVADHGLPKGRDNINIPYGGVVLASHPAVVKYPGELRAVDVGSAGVEWTKKLGPAATLPRVLDLIARGDPAPSEAATPTPRGGPPAGDGLDMAAIRAALHDWTGPWPPPQDQITDYTARRVRQVLHDARTSWRAEVEAAER